MGVLSWRFRGKKSKDRNRCSRHKSSPLDHYWIYSGTNKKKPGLFPSCTWIKGHFPSFTWSSNQGLSLFLYCKNTRVKWKLSVCNVFLNWLSLLMHCGETLKAHERHATFSFFKHCDFSQESLCIHPRLVCQKDAEPPRWAFDWVGQPGGGQLQPPCQG